MEDLEVQQSLVGEVEETGLESYSYQRQL